MFGSFGFQEMLLVFVVALLVFGPNKLPDIAKTLGKTIREFRNTINEAKATIEVEIEKADMAEELRKIETDVKAIDLTNNFTNKIKFDNYLLKTDENETQKNTGPENDRNKEEHTQ